MTKFNLSSFFKTSSVEDISDFIAVKIESINEYYVKKCRQDSFIQGKTVSHINFYKLLSNSTRPIILSDTYINID